MARFLVQDTVGGSTPVCLKIEKDTISIGRSIESDVRLDDLAVSRQHVIVDHVAGGWTLIDRGGRHGTYVDGERLVERMTIAPGNTIQIGRYRVVFEPVRDCDTDETNPAEPHRIESRLVGKLGLNGISRKIERIAPSDSTVLLTGESGTGKELVARLMHELSPRSRGPYVVVNCPAIPPGMAEYELFGIESRAATGVEGRAGRIESAAGGTVLLDEIGDMSMDVQSKMLRFLQDRKIDCIGSRRSKVVDVRVVAATHRNLDEAVAGGTFRGDLLHRLRALAIHLPPLRDRPEDLDELIEYFLRARLPHRRLSTNARQYLEEHAFPGNVRELEHMLARGHLFADGPLIEVTDLCSDRWDGDFDATIPPGAVKETGELSPADRRGDPVQELYDAIVRRRCSFWEMVHQPFRRGTLPAETARGLIERGYEESRRSYRRMARLFHIDEQHGYRRLVDFLRRSGLSCSRRRAK